MEEAGKVERARGPGVVQHADRAEDLALRGVHLLRARGGGAARAGEPGAGAVREGGPAGQRACQVVQQPVDVAAAYPPVAVDVEELEGVPAAAGLRGGAERAWERERRRAALDAVASEWTRTAALADAPDPEDLLDAQLVVVYPLERLWGPRHIAAEGQRGRATGGPVGCWLHSHSQRAPGSCAAPAGARPASRPE